MNLRETAWEILDLIQLAQDWIRWQAVTNTGINTVGNFLTS